MNEISQENSNLMFDANHGITEHRIENGDGLTNGGIHESKDGKIKRCFGSAIDIIWGIGNGPIPESFFPVQNAPQGNQRIVLEQKQPGKIWIKNKDCVRCWVLEIKEGKLWVNDKREVKAIYAHDFPEIKMP